MLTCCLPRSQIARVLTRDSKRLCLTNPVRRNHLSDWRLAARDAVMLAEARTLAEWPSPAFDFQSKTNPTR